MVIHTFGDSHSGWPKDGGWNAVSINGVEVKTHWIGARRCSTFGFKKKELLDIRDYDVKNGETVCFCFGEIDCRCHINKTHANYKDTINDIVDSYFDAIKQNIDGFMNLIVMVYNVIPPVRHGTIEDNPDFPLTGSDEERKLYTEYMNGRIRDKCIENSFLFFNVYKDYCDEDGFLKYELSDGNVHIQDNRYIEENIKRLFNLP
jgi:hypothetical protein